MPTTTRLQDFLGRWLGNANPGTTQATDHLGRNIGASNTDFIGRALQFNNPTAWAATTAYSLNDYRRLTTGEILRVTSGGTSGASEPTPPASVGGSVTDGTVTWVRVK